jgi:2-amino-4-hydroxy-6-hydroxymethyldihydropteridine diphosphokinase
VNSAFIALGSNLGDSKALVTEAMNRLEALSTRPIVRSSLWRSSPVDCPPGAGDFINAVVEVVPHPGETPESILRQLQQLEREFGRRPKTISNESRPLDLDLLAWGDEVRHTPELTVPHPRAHLRRFVLAPLTEIAPELILPGQQKTVRELLETMRTDEKVGRLNQQLS